MTSSRALCFAIALPAAACAVEADDELVTPLDEATDTQSILAEITVPTADGAAAYTFTFAEADGAIATLVAVPDGYPDPVDDDCPLTTFLRVAPDDAIVPDALRRACPVEGQPLEVGERRVADLRPATLSFEVTPSPAAPLPALCDLAKFNERVSQLQSDAAYIPQVPVCDFGCILWVGWDELGCNWLDAHGGFLELCEDTDYQWLVNTYGPTGLLCQDYGWIEGSCEMTPNHACDHPWFVNPHPGAVTSWAWFQADGKTTKFRVEVSPCNNTSTMAGYWKTRKDPTAPWGALHLFSHIGASRLVVQLFSGIDGTGRYLGADYYVEVWGISMNIVSANVQMKGLPAATCPIKI